MRNLIEPIIVSIITITILSISIIALATDIDGKIHKDEIGKKVEVLSSNSAYGNKADWLGEGTIIRKSLKYYWISHPCNAIQKVKRGDFRFKE